MGRKGGDTMPTMLEIAEKFFDACETGKGWAGCKKYCHPDATFSCQAESLSEVGTLEEYAEFMKGLYIALPDGGYDLKSFAVDEDRNKVLGFAVFKGSNTGEGGPAGAPTGKSVSAEYVYVMEFGGEYISHMTKIWNDTFTFKQLGWM